MWAFIRELWRMAVLCRFSVFLSLAALVALTLVEQSLEAFRVLAENYVAAPMGWALAIPAWNLVALLLFAALLGLVCWYSARLLTYLHEADTLSTEGWEKRIAEWLPRACVVPPLLGVVVGAYLAAKPYSQSAPDEPVVLLRLAIAAGALIPVSLFLLMFRRRLLGLQMPLPHKPELRLLPKGSQRVLRFLILAAAGSMAVIAVHPWIAMGFGGPLQLALFALCGIVPVGTLLIHASRRDRLPWLGIVVFTALLLSFLDANDNHELRSKIRHKPVESHAFETAFKAWLMSRADLDRYDVYPVVIVASEGGGLRAAYFSAYVLSELHDWCPIFAQHVFAISGVSGGSVGAATFAALYSTSAGNERSLDCPRKPPASLTMARHADGVLSADLLTPMLATGLFPDLAQRFLFPPFPPVDRARTLERSLERSWNDRMGYDAFAGSFYSFQSPRDEAVVPALFLNTTHVESGNRMVISGITPDQVGPEAMDVLVKALPQHDIALSTAAFASARFPLVSPAAYIHRKPYGSETDENAKAMKMRYVDGGYFDNSATATLFDILNALEEIWDYHPQFPGHVGKRFKVIVLWIGNSPTASASTGDIRPVRGTSRYLGESLSPIRAMLNAREARSDDSVRRLRNEVARTINSSIPRPGAPGSERMKVSWAEFRLIQGTTPLPLGWLLSKRARLEMQTQIHSPPCGNNGNMNLNNDCSFLHVREQLALNRKP